MPPALLVIRAVAGGALNQPVNLNPTNAQNAANAMNTVGAPARPSNTSSTSSSTLNWWMKHLKSLNASTIFGILSFFATVIFGPPAWKLAKNSLTATVQSLHFSQWEICADHIEIQNATTCKTLLNINFDAISNIKKRSFEVVKTSILTEKFWVRFVVLFIFFANILFTLNNARRPKKVSKRVKCNK